MMISPMVFAADNKGKSYEELIAVRDELMDEIKVFKEGRIPQKEYAICPSPDTRYNGCVGVRRYPKGRHFRMLLR